MDSKQLRFQDKNLKSERVEKLSEGEMAGNTPQLEKDVNPQTSIEPSVQVKCPGDILQGGRMPSEEDGWRRGKDFIWEGETVTAK